MKTIRLIGHAAIGAASLDASIVLNKHTDPISPEALGVTLGHARAIANEDPSLIWCDAPVPRTIAELEIASNAACSAHDAAEERLSALLAIVGAINALEVATTAAALTGADCAPFASPWANLQAPLHATLKSIALIKVEIDRLETECHRAAKAMNDAPEEAA